MSQQRISSRLNMYMINFAKKVQEKQLKVGEKTVGTAKMLAPTDTALYKNSLKVLESGVKNNVVTTEVGTRYKVANEEWSNVALGIFLEFGTGPKGQQHTTAKATELGAVYTTTGWTYFSERLDRYVYTEGMIPRPHLEPAARQHRETYLKEMRSIKGVRTT